MNRIWLGLAAVAAVALVVAGVFVWQRQPAPPPAPVAAEAVPMSKVRPPDTATAVEIPESPYLVIPNELVVLLKEGQTVEAFAKSLAGGGAVKIIGAIPRFRLVQVEVPAAERKARKAELKANPLVEAVTYQSVFTNQARPRDPALTNDDPADDWNLRAINAEAAWDITPGRPDVIIAVVDAGVLLDHEELTGKIVKPATTFSKDGRTQVGSPKGLGHGTHVAITAAGATGNGAGTSGVCPRCRIMPVQVAREENGTGLTTIAAGIEYAVLNGARVVNVSMGPSYSRQVKRFGEASERRGIKNFLLAELKRDLDALGNIFKFAEARGATVVVAWPASPA